MADQFRDFKLDTTTGDLVFDDAGKAPAAVGGLDSIAQEVSVLLRTFEGEWFADLEEGVPYIPDLIQAKPTDAQVISILRPMILEVPGVTGIDSIAIVRGSGRTATITADLETDTGELSQLAAEIEV
jgi:hypothetical protein